MAIERPDISDKKDKLKLLIADDDTPTRMLLRAAILQWGYEVVEAKDGEEAWEILQKDNAPRLLILDWLMPKIDGITLSERCKKELNYHPYIILLTQVSGTSNLIKGLEAGADEFLSKPFNMAELRSRLSIGSRIIKYDIERSEQNVKLQSYVNKMEVLSNSALNILQQTNEVLKNEAMLNEEKLATVQNNLKKINKLIEDFEANNKQIEKKV